ncbi:hypothetical protein B296_00021824 [Ensete ventricosum]|uniref:Uncharacterized protein n=1 Tax=Ensete ventricosum TaxID=4639 RepID=A0A426Z763_ENSVE|nr:hypothetical protein B296_00021824 [Ensete ventricosum]
MQPPFNLAVFLAESACSGHAVDDPGRTLGRSRVGDNRIKRLRTGLPQAVDRSCGGSSRVGKRPLHATEAVQAVASHANNRVPMANDMQNVVQAATAL